jgi:large subunit ribosomal protein L10
MVSETKQKFLAELKEILKSYKTILLFDLENLPSKQLHYIRNKLKNDEIFTLISKKRILEFALRENKINLDLNDIKQPGLIYSNKDIFEVSKKLKELKVKRKAKTGEKASSDIEVPAGDTGIQAGPAISIFKQFKIQTIMKDGKIAIKDPTVVCKTGNEIDLNLVSLLNMLGIEPIEMNLSPEKGYFNKMVYNKFVLNLDKNYFVENIGVIANNLFKLTIYLNYPTKQNISLLLQKGYRNSRNLGIKLGAPFKRNIV